MKPFDLLHTPLREGMTLLEASAGTGKTHTLAGLFLRLLVEKKARHEAIDVDEVLVVTYTEAATEELRDRIRQLLRLAVEGFQTGRSDDRLVQELLRRHSDQRPALAEQLALSLHCFDLAPIHTIHGFCQRALQDRAFESGSLFDTEVLADQTTLMQEIADDYWRRTFYTASPLRVAVALKRKLGPSRLLPFLKSCLSHFGLKLATRAGEITSEVLGTQLDGTFARAGALWREQAPQIQTRLGSSGWSRRPYKDAGEMRDLFGVFDRAFAEGAADPDTLGSLESLASSRLSESMNRRTGLLPPSHPFFDLCERLIRLEADYATALQRDFFRYAQTELRTRKEKQKLLSYEDLLTGLHDALTGPDGALLAEELRRKYQAALIDEFQDTDSVQCNIFRRIFSQPGRSLVFIGDPKQAIYGFRGADVFTYMEAARQTAQRFTLDQNWRSETGLLRAINAVFERAVTPFVFEDIRFPSVTAAGKADQTPLTIGGQHEPPLHLWFHRRNTNNKEIPKGQAEIELSRAVAAEISRLLNSDALLGGRRLRPQDFAVLVMTHHQARVVQEALNGLGIPSVQQTQQSVFATDEAVDVFRLLSAIVQPSNAPAIRAALATSLIGETAASLHALEANETAWQERLQRFRDDFEYWTERGFTPMFRRLLDREAVRARLVSRLNGERALTNVLHLAEALHAASINERLGAGGLLKWLATHIDGDDVVAEEHQLRLERDENAVQLVTVHKSKGLEYEIAFVPFCWRDSELKARNQKSDEQQVLFHDRATGELVRDLGPDFSAAHLGQAKGERLAENVRLLYVALTRARHRCYLAWGAFSGSANSAPAWLFHRARGMTADAESGWKLNYASCSDEQMRQDLFRLSEESRSGGVPRFIQVCDVPTEPGLAYHLSEDRAQALRCRRFAGPIERDWRIASFSGFVSGRRDETPDHDADEAAAEEEAEATGIFAFPAGTRPGTCLHKILEELDFAASDPASIEELVSRHLREHALLQTGHLAAVSAAIRRVLDTPIDPARPRLKFSGIKRSECLSELEFYFPLRRISSGRLSRIFARHGGPALPPDWPEKLGRLTFSPSRGFLKGFIDLVFRHDGRFFLVDWKSNRLGNRIEDYSPDRLRREMARRYYALQYHLYVLALHRYLKLRLPDYQYDQHFGGVRYLFLRGLDPSRPEFGVFSDLPARVLIEELEDELLERAEVEK